MIRKLNEVEQCKVKTDADAIFSNPPRNYKLMQEYRKLICRAEY